MIDVGKIDRDRLSVVLRFLPFFGRKRIILFTRDKGNVFDPVNYNIKIHQFIDALYECGQFEKILTRLKFFKSTPMIKKRVALSRKEEQE